MMIDIHQNMFIILHKEGGGAMYKKMYLILFHAITDAMDMIEAHKYQEALDRLEQASRDAEEVYISQ